MTHVRAVCFGAQLEHHTQALLKKNQCQSSSPPSWSEQQQCVFDFPSEAAQQAALRARFLLCFFGESPESACAPPILPPRLLLFVETQAVCVVEANAAHSAALRSAPQPSSAVLPHPRGAELSAPTAQILVNSETKPPQSGP